jgi:hypothetical protein
MTKVNVFEKKDKDQRVKVVLPVKYESPTTYQCKVKVFKMEVKLRQRVKVIVSNERSCQRVSTCQI